MPADLQSLVGLFSSELEGSPQANLGKPLKFKLSPSDLGSVKLPSIVPADMNLTWISKNVLFNNFGIEQVFNDQDFDVTDVDSLLLGKLPVRLPKVAGTVIGGILNEEINGVQGLLSQLRGSLPVVMDLQVKVSVRWRIYDADSTTELTSGFIALTSLEAFEVSLLFEPAIVELTNAASIPTVDRFVEAEVTLSIGTEPPLVFKLPQIKVIIPAIPVPRIAAFFLHKSFQAKSGDDDGALFIVLPNNSPFSNLTQLQSVLNTLENTLDTLNGFTTLASFLLGITDINNAISAQLHVQIRTANSSNNFDNFNDVTLKEDWMGWLFGWSNTEAEDELSSMIYLGPPRTGVRCFNARNEGTSEGDFTLTAGTFCHAKILDLHSASPTPTPTGNAALTVNTTPPGGWFNPSDFGDALSSLSFV